MKSTTFTYLDYAQIEIFVYKWIPDENIPIKGVVYILHGMAEHAARYEHVAHALTDAGYIVYADDHRGHGKTAIDLEHAGILGTDGWEGTLKAIKELADKIKTDHANLPVFLLGHSWGSYLAQNFIQKWGNSLKGVILSGTNGKQPMLNILKIVGKIIAKRKGFDAKAEFIDKLAIKPLNKPFEPAKSPNAWLSRDETVAEKYDADPWCGYMMPNSYFLELANGLKTIWNPINEAKIPRNLPIHIFSGSEDPSNAQTKGMMVLIERYKKLGIVDLSYKIYQGGRHEMFNETNQEEVISDVISWLDHHL